MEEENLNQQPNESETPSDQTAQAPKEFKVRKWPVLVIVFLFLIILGMGGYILYLNKQTKTVANPSATTTSPAESGMVSSTPTPTETNTKTYTDSQFGFSFKYPTDWKITTHYEGGAPYIKLNLGLIQSDQSKQESTSPPIFVDQYDNPNNLSVSDWQDDYNKDKPLQRQFYSPTDTETSVAGVKAYVNPKQNCEPFNCYQTIVMAKNNVFIFYNLDYGNTVPGENFSDNQKVYDQVVSNLQFSK